MTATLFLTVGLPATGKTTAARRIETERDALRLTKDEWMKALYGDQNPEQASDVIEGRLVGIALRAPTSGETTFRRIPRGACPVYCLDERRRKGRVLADRSKPVEA